MNRRLASIVILLALMSARRAAAQTQVGVAPQADVTVGYQGLPYKSTGESSTGINLAEGMLLHVGAGVEAGYDSNVFYSNSSDAGGVISSDIIRVTTFGELTNSTRNGAERPSVVYDVRAGLVYRLYTSDNPEVEKYRTALMPTAGLGLSTNSGHWAFQLTDSFIRQEDPPYAGISGTAAAVPITRDSNLASVQAQWSPGGGRISGTLRYDNTIDVFEQDSGFDYASSLSNQLVLDVSWKWLPKTALFLQASQGWITYLNDTSPSTQGGVTADTRKASSYPLRIYVGLRGLITQKVTAMVALGYVDAFYASGTSNSGILGSTYVDAQVSFAPSMLNRLTLGFHQDVVNSVISNFYYETAVYGSYVQQIAGRVALDLSGRLSHRIYEDLLFDPTHSRTDNTITAGATLDYFIRNWAYVGVGYSLLANLSDYHLPPGPAGGAGESVEYTKNQVFARLGITY
jgi:hypothetical protein